MTAIEEVGRAKRRIYLDGDPAFVLYRGEVSACRLTEGEELSPELYEHILEEILWKRIRERSLRLLQDMDRTEQQVREKLRQGLYPAPLIDRVVEWLYSYHYLDDERYAEHFVRSRAGARSVMQLRQELARRGISRQTAEAAIAAADTPDEELLIRRLVEKRRIDPADCTEAERRRLYAYLARRGFSASAILRVLRESEE